MTYPVLPLKNTVLFPHILMPVAVGRPQSLAAVETAQATEEKKVIVAVQRDPTTQPQTLDDFYPVATIGVVMRTVQRQENVIQAFYTGSGDPATGSTRHVG
jgi:ATP-dependent Lon protease